MHPEQQEVSASIRVRIGDRSQLGNLVEYLEARDCTIGFRGGDLEVRPRHVHAGEPYPGGDELSSTLHAWAAAHPEAGFEVVQQAPSGRRRVA